jgi:hypothetical protein
MTTAREETSRLVDLLRREHSAMGDFLVALAKFDRERYWESLGYRSLFEFLRRELRLSAGAAQYRKTAAELVQKYPEVEPALRAGDLCLSSVIEVAKVLTPENAAEMLPRFFGLSSRDAAFVAASIRPVENPPRRGYVVTQVRSPATPDAPAPAPDTTAESLELRAPELPSLESSPPPSVTRPARCPAPSRPMVQPLDAERARVSMTVSRRLLNKLAAARDALSHSHPGASEETVLEVGLDLILLRHAKRRGIGARPRATSPKSHPGAPPAQPTSTERSRHVPAAVWRGVWERDHGCCAWPLENGGVCGSTRQLELDHVKGWALGAETTVEECRILCRFHQDLSARELYGSDLMDHYTRPKGSTCSEPVAAYGREVTMISTPSTRCLLVRATALREIEISTRPPDHETVGFSRGGIASSEKAIVRSAVPSVALEAVSMTRTLSATDVRRPFAYSTSSTTAIHRPDGSGTSRMTLRCPLSRQPGAIVTIPASAARRPIDLIGFIDVALV